MALASRINLSSQYLFGMATLCFLSCVSLHQGSGGHIQNFSEIVCPEVCSCTSHGLVDCSNRNLTSTPDKNELPEDAYSYFLNDNSISVISGYSFNTTPNLTFLDLKYNSKLISIDDNAFSGLVRLQGLDISNQVFDHHSPIQKINRNWFKGLTHLTDVNLMSINAAVIDDYTFSDNKNIEFIDLSVNYLIDIPSHLFQNLSKLRFIDVCCNRLTEIDGDLFSGSNHVEEIRLHHNSINKIHKNTFKSMKNISRIDLSNNKLTSDNIALQTFRGLTRLTKLSLSVNNLKTIKKEWFQDMSSLKQFDCSSNSITEIPSTLFRGLPNLVNLIFTDNHIDNIGDDAFQDSNHIRLLIFDSNLFKTVSKSIGLQHLPNLKYINFDANPFQCNCDLVWFIRWIQSSDVRSYIRISNNLVCIAPPNLAFCRLMALDPDLFSCSSHVVVIVVSIVGVLVIITSVLYYFRWDIRYLYQRRKLRKQYQQLNEDVDGPPNTQENIFDAFISYSSKDCNWVTNVLHPTLENDPYKFKLFIDYRDFIPGNSIVDNIARAIKCSHKTIMILTKNFLRSQWCYFELEMARLRLLESSEDVFIIVLLEKINTKDMPLKLQQVLRKKSYIRWPKDESARRLFWSKLETELRSPNTLK